VHAAETSGPVKDIADFTELFYFLDEVQKCKYCTQCVEQVHYMYMYITLNRKARYVRNCSCCFHKTMIRCVRKLTNVRLGLIPSLEGLRYLFKVHIRPILLVL